MAHKNNGRPYQGRFYITCCKFFLVLSTALTTFSRWPKADNLEYPTVKAAIWPFFDVNMVSP